MAGVLDLRLRRPSSEHLQRLLERCRNEALTYAPTGVSLGGDGPPHLARRRWTTSLPPDALARASDAIDGWAAHRGAGLEVATDGPIAAGTNVALAAPMPVGFVDATCRIVTIVDEADRYGFAYGTLPVHPEQGEESFLVARLGDGTVRFTVEAVSRPVHPLARLVPPLASRLQDATCKRYLAAMRDAVS